MRFLNKTDIISIDRTLIQNAVLHAYELMIRNEYNMPDRMHVQDGQNTLLLMPCFGTSYFATKLVSVFPGAPEQGLPAVNGIMTLADNDTGKPLAIMDGAALTAERTGAVGGLAVNRLTGIDIETAGIFGAGVQGMSQVRYMLLNRHLKKVMIYDINLESAKHMAGQLGDEFPGVAFEAAYGADEMVAACDLIIAATTSPSPLFSDDKALVSGKTFISIGSFRPDMKEFPDAVISSADKVFVDTPFAAKESGDICQPLEKGVVKKDQIIPFAKLIEMGVAAEENTKDPLTLFFKSVGMALFDMTVASALYEIAEKNNLGTTLDF